jgi:hypothetical protein
MNKFFLAVVLLASLRSSAQDYSTTGKRIVYSETLKKAKKYTDIDKALLAPGQVHYLHIVSYGKDSSLQKLSDSIGKLTNLRKLVVMNYGAYVSLSPGLWELKELEHLALFNFPGLSINGIAELKELKYLSLDGIGLKDIPPGLLELQKLEFLDLSCNRLSQLPRDIGKLALLKELELTNNCFTSIPPEIEKLVMLQHLTINNAERGAVLADGTIVCNNSITSFPVVFAHTKSLKKVSCFFKVDIEPGMKTKIKAAYPGIKFK